MGAFEFVIYGKPWPVPERAPLGTLPVVGLSVDVFELWASVPEGRGLARVGPWPTPSAS